MATAASTAITISELAEKIGLSKSTVSRALSDYPDISAATKKRVLEAAESYNYRPSSYAQSIKTGVAKSVALILSVSNDIVQHASLADLLDGLSNRLGQEQWTLTVATAATDQSDTDLQRRLIEEKKVDGFIIPRVKIDDPRIALMRSYDMPYVIYGRSQPDSDEAFYDLRTEECMAAAVVRFAELGHKRIGYIGTDTNYVMSGIRESGYLAGLRTASLPCDASLIRRNAMTQHTGKHAASSLLKQKQPPTAIVCAMDAAALGVYKAASELTLEIGKDVSVIGYDGISEGSYVSPALTTYANNSNRAGSILADLLLKKIRGDQSASLQVLTDPVLINRESHGPPRRTSEELAAFIGAG
jgi:LacI family transcriptional regulator